MGTRIPTGIFLVAGLVLLVVMPGLWIIASILITIAAVIRIRDLRRGKFKFAPWPLTVIALIMPRPAAHSYLEEIGHSANEVSVLERRRHVRNAIQKFPETLVTVWHGWTRIWRTDLRDPVKSSGCNNAHKKSLFRFGNAGGAC